MNRAHSFSDRTGEMIVYGVEESKVQRGALRTHDIRSHPGNTVCAPRARVKDGRSITRGRQINQSISGGLQVLSDVDVCKC